MYVIKHPRKISFLADISIIRIPYNHMSFTFIQENHPAHFSSGHVMITIILLIAATPACVGTLSLLVTQYYAVFYNITTLEQFSCRRLKQYALEIGDTEWSFVYPYDQGKYNNFLDIFGSKPLHWFFPIVENQEQLKSWPINKNHRQPKHYESV